MSLLGELQRRNVIRMAGLYLVGAWLVLQVAATLLPVFEAPAWVMKVVVALLAIGLIAALVFAWVFELTPEGLKRDADCREFRIRRAVLAQGDHLKFAAGEQPRLLSVVSGNLRLTSGQTLKRGDNALLPYADAFDFETPDGALVLITENFTN